MGKSSLINGLVGRKVVSVSRTPGHTRYFQTYFLTPSVKLCDCPGLIFPSLLPRQLQVCGRRGWIRVGRTEGGPVQGAKCCFHRFWLESTPLPRSRSPTLLWATWPPESLCRPCCTCATQRQRTLRLSTPGVPGTSVKVGFLASPFDSCLPCPPHSDSGLKEEVVCLPLNFFTLLQSRTLAWTVWNTEKDWAWG